MIPLDTSPLPPAAAQVFTSLQTTLQSFGDDGLRSPPHTLRKSRSQTRSGYLVPLNDVAPRSTSSLNLTSPKPPASPFSSSSTNIHAHGQRSPSARGSSRAASPDITSILNRVEKQLLGSQDSLALAEQNLSKSTENLVRVKIAAQSGNMDHLGHRSRDRDYVEEERHAAGPAGGYGRLERPSSRSMQSLSSLHGGSASDLSRVRNGTSRTDLRKTASNMSLSPVRNSNSDLRKFGSQSSLRKDDVKKGSHSTLHLPPIDLNPRPVISRTSSTTNSVSNSRRTSEEGARNVTLAEAAIKAGQRRRRKQTSQNSGLLSSDSDEESYDEEDEEARLRAAMISSSVERLTDPGLFPATYRERIRESLEHRKRLEEAKNGLEHAGHAGNAGELARKVEEVTGRLSDPRRFPAAYKAKAVDKSPLGSLEDISGTATNPPRASAVSHKPPKPKIEFFTDFAGPLDPPK
ncbi:hypothetical protein HDU85_000049 [Gaertneriomyces sp. JEL0708]|nr:hypothetical protein HDU85_000049 [Gaertneriomyces sp. JEL0708]